MAVRHRLPRGWKRPRVRKAGTAKGWSAGMAQAMAALYGQLPPMTADEQAQHEHDAAGVPYRNDQGDLPLRLPVTE
jgi:hypothetical protein